MSLQVRGAADYQAAVRALETSLTEIRALRPGLAEAPPGVDPEDAGVQRPDPILPATTGPVTGMEADALPPEMRVEIAQIVAEHLHRAGVTEATVGLPTDPSPVELAGRSVTLGAFLPPGLTPREGQPVLPAGWCGLATDWVTARLEQTQMLAGAIGSGSQVDSPVSAAGVAELFRATNHHDIHRVRVAAGDPDAGLRAAAIGPFESEMALTTGRVGIGDDELVAAIDELAGMARRLAQEAAYAFVTTEWGLSLTGAGFDWARQSRLDKLHFTWTCDEACWDALPVQILGPGHVARLGGPPPGAVDLGGGKVEVRPDKPADWLIDIQRITQRLHRGEPFDAYRANPQVVADARRQLAACLFTNDTMRSLLHDRRRQGR